MAIKPVIESLEERRLLSVSFVEVSAPPADEGIPLFLDGVITNPTSTSRHRVAIDWGDGSTVQNYYCYPDPADNYNAYFDRTHTYVHDGDYTITLTARDQNNIADTVTTTITAHVNPVAPVVQLGAPLTRFSVGDTFTPGVRVVDSGGNEITSWDFDWGDGTTDQYTGAIPAASHVYTSAGDFTLSVTPHDPDFSTLPPVSQIVFDSAFADHGLQMLDLAAATTGTPYSWEQTDAMARSLSGKLLVGGTMNNNVAVTQYDDNGQLDSNFGNLGLATADFSGFTSSFWQYTNAMFVQSDGGIVVAGTVGYSSGGVGHSDFALTRFTAAGVLDTTFGNQGLVQTTFTGWDSRINQITIAGDGLITAVGFAGSDLAIARYNPDGSLDTSFDTDGKMTIDLGGFADIAYMVKIDPLGRYVLAGRSDTDDFLLRYNPDGARDTTFGDNADGDIIFDIGSNDHVYDLAFDSMGRIVLVGDANGAAAIIRRNDDGTADTSFNSTGHVIQNQYLASNSYYLANVAIDDANRIVASGVANNDLLIERLTADGSQDTTFAEDGATHRPGGFGQAWSRALGLFSDNGQITAAWNALTMNGMIDIGLARFAGQNFVTVIGTPPTVTITPDPNNPSTVYEGDSFTLNLSASANQGEEPITGWVIFVGDRTINVAGNQPSVTFALDSGTYDISAAAIGLHGDLYDATGTHNVTVINVAPGLSGDLRDDPLAPVTEGQTVSLHANATDPGPNDVLSYAWNITKNGSPFMTGTGQDFDFVPDDNGVYQATATVTDADGDTDTASDTITVDNAVPTQVDAGQDQTADEGEQVHLFGYASDPGSADTLNWNWAVSSDNGDSISDGEEQDFAFTPKDNGTYTIILTVTDDDGGYTTDEVVITVDNVAPFVLGGGTTYNDGYYQPVNYSLTPGTPITLPVTLTDPGEYDSPYYYVDWGDGQTESGGMDFVIGHTYGTQAEGGSYNNYDLSGRTVTLRAYDQDGGESTDQFTYAVDYVNDFEGGETGYWQAGIVSVGTENAPAHVIGLFEGNGTQQMMSLPNVVQHDVLTLQLDVVQIGNWAGSGWDASNFSLLVDDNTVTPTSVQDLGDPQYDIEYPTGDPCCGPTTANYATHAYRLSYTFVHGESDLEIEAAVSGLNDGSSLTNSTLPGGGNDESLHERWAIDNVKLTADRVDVQLGGLGEDGRNGPDEAEGGYMSVNNNDTDGDGTADSDESTCSPSDPDLVPLNIPYPAAPPSTQLVLSVQSGGAAAKIYDSNGTPITLDEYYKHSFTLDGNAGTQTLFLGAADSTNIIVKAALEAANRPATTGNTASIQPLDVQLDVDSKSNSGFNADPHNHADSNGIVEDAIEDDDDKPGKIVVISDDDLDADGIRDDLDGYNRDGISGNFDDLGPARKLVPMVLKVSPALNTPAARFRFIYDSADPFGEATMSSDVPSEDGSLRIWNKDAVNGSNAPQARDGSSVSAGGNFIGGYGRSGGGTYTAAQLGIGASGRVDLFVEGIATSLAKGDQRVVIEVDPTGTGHFIQADAVRFTNVDLDVLIGASDDQDLSLHDDWVGAQRGTTSADRNVIVNYVTLEGPASITVPVDMVYYTFNGSGSVDLFTLANVNTPNARSAAQFSVTTGASGFGSQQFFIEGRDASSATENILIAANYGNGAGVAVGGETMTVLQLNPEQETYGGQEIPANPSIVTSSAPSFGGNLFAVDVGKSGCSLNPDPKDPVLVKAPHTSDIRGGSVPLDILKSPKIAPDKIEVIWARVENPGTTSAIVSKSTTLGSWLDVAPTYDAGEGFDRFRMRDLGITGAMEVAGTPIDYVFGHPSEGTVSTFSMINNYAAKINSKAATPIHYTLAVHVMEERNAAGATVGTLGLKPTADVDAIVDKLNTVWSQAGIDFQIGTGLLFEPQITTVTKEFDVNDNYFRTFYSTNAVTSINNQLGVIDVYLVRRIGEWSSGKGDLAGTTIYEGMHAGDKAGILIARQTTLGNNVSRRGITEMARTLAHEMAHYLMKVNNDGHRKEQWNLMYVDDDTKRDLDATQVTEARKFVPVE